MNTAEMASEKAAAKRRSEVSVANIVGLLGLCFVPGEFVSLDAKYTAGAVPNSKNSGILPFLEFTSFNFMFI